MTASKRGTALVALSLCFLPAGPEARADELLVMPYACTVIGGRPVLSPGPEQSHRIVGPREQRKFTACSPADPGRCRSWTVHRFDLDCDGTRVPWVSVMGAAGEANRRARLAEGRLQLRLGPAWNLAPDDPCAREPGLDDRFSGRMRRYCADRLAMEPPPVVEMPLGFAPMLGIDAIFVKAAPGIGPPPPPPPPKAARGEAQQTELDGIPAPEPPRAPVAKEVPAKSPPPALPDVAIQPLPKVAPPRPAEAPVQPKVNNRPEPMPVDRQPPAAEVAKKVVPAEPKPAPKIAAPLPVAPAPAKDAAAESPPPAKAVPGPEDKSATINLLTVFRTTTTGAIVAFAGLALGVLTAFALARRRERVRHAGMRPRDIGSVTLNATRAAAPTRLGFAGGRVPPNAATSAMSRVRGASVPTRGARVDWGDRMPGTRTEALLVLGIGVAPSANEAAIKKIVDGLRLSWHPDHAKDEADRQLRELRSKQINAAWELLQGQRAEA